jgi:hypothetical protein
MKLLKNNRANKSWLINLFALLSYLALLVPIYMQAYMGTFSRYIADDYCTAGKLELYGYWGAITQRYMSWDGRFTFTFLIYLFHQFGVKFASILPTISITLFLIVSFYFFCQFLKLFGLQSKKHFALFLSGLLLFVLQYTIPQLAEDFYWLTGITTYQFSIIFELLLLAIYIQTMTSIKELSKFSKIARSIGLFILAFIGSGFSEVSTAINVCIFGLILLVTIFNKVIYKKSSSKDIYSYDLFLGAFIGFVVMLTAPGNTHRDINMSGWAVHPSLYKTLISSFVESIKYSIKWFINYPGIIWPVLLVTILLTAYYKTNNSFTEKSTTIEFSTKNFLIWLICIFISIFVSFVPTTWAGYTVPADHILIMTTILLCAALFLCAIFFGFKLGQLIDFSKIQIMDYKIFLVIFLVLFSSSIALNTARHYYYDLIGPQKSYAEKWDKINAEILVKVKAGEQDIITKNVPNDVQGNERITQNPDFWVNICAANYYQVKTIIAY